ncbi:MAG: ATP synthase F0 subunit B [Acidobacteriaceae bacterium]
MKTLTRCLSAVLFAALLSGPAAHLHAQATSDSPSSQRSKPSAGGGEHMDEPETNSDIEQYRHSSTVNAIARIAHVKTETAAQIFEDLNSGVLILAIAIFLWKMVPKMLRKRSETLEKELVQARLATDDANRRLAEVEARLLRLDSEIDAIRHQVEQEAVSDEQRIHAALETERERIVASAEQEIGAVQAAAQRDLKKFAANLAIDNAMRRIQLSTDTDRALVREFGKSLNKDSGGEA